MKDSTWRELISEEMKSKDDSWDNVVAKTISDVDLDEKFYSGYGAEQGKPFTLWTKARVYFPVCYDGAEWCGSVPRDPGEEIVKHVGG